MPDKPLDFSDIRPAIMAFALLMEKELRIHEQWAEGKNEEAVDLARRVKESANELLAIAGFRLRPPVVTPIDPEIAKRIVEEATAAANMAMLVAELSGCLDEAVREFALHQADLEIKDKQRGPLPFIENSTPKSRVRGYSEAFHAGFEAGYRGWTVTNPYVSGLHRKVWEEGALVGRRIVTNELDAYLDANKEDNEAEGSA